MRAIETGGRYSFTTFEEYVEERWGRDRTWSHRLIEAADAAQKMLPIVNVLPTSESHGRELLKLGCTLVSNAVCSQGPRIWGPTLSCCTMVSNAVCSQRESVLRPLAKKNQVQAGKQNGRGKKKVLANLPEAIDTRKESAKVAEARAKPLADVGPPTKEEKDNVGNTNNKLNGTTVDYTLRRLARDKPELLDKIEAGEDRT